MLDLADFIWFYDDHINAAVLAGGIIRSQPTIRWNDSQPEHMQVHLRVHEDLSISLQIGSQTYNLDEMQILYDILGSAIEEAEPEDF